MLMENSMIKISFRDLEYVVFVSFYILMCHCDSSDSLWFSLWSLLGKGKGKGKAVPLEA